MAERFIPFEARKRGTEWVAEVQVRFTYTLDEAARAIAVEHPTVPRRFGARTIQRALREAAAHGYTSNRRLTKADPEMTEFYREKLLELGIFPREAAERSGS